MQTPTNALSPSDLAELDALQARLGEAEEILRALSRGEDAPLGNLRGRDLVASHLSDQLERAQLREAKELAEKANLAKDNFLAALSHELRTPLTPALMVAARLEHDLSLPDSARRSLATIRHNVELEARLIDDLLDLTRITRGKLELHRGLIDVHHLLRSALEICQPDIEAKGLSLQLQFEARATETVGDAVRVQQIFWNLLRNAAKFTPVGGGITIRTAETSDTIRVEISDTGIGFEPEMEPRIFRAFEQGGRQITQQFGGLGLGLTISRSLAEAHGGHLQASSPGLGRGATFTLELPRSKTDATPTKNESPASSTTPVATPPLRILLVEDHPDTRTNLALLLSSYQHDVKTASSAVEALAAAAGNKFDLVISDLGLPDQSGLEMMRVLRDRFGLKGIAVSGYGMEDDIAQSRAAGFVHHLTKPIAFERLRSLIAEMAR